MDISDLLKLVQGQGGAPDTAEIDPAKLAANPPPQAPAAPQGVGDFLGSSGISGNPGAPAPQPAAPPPMADESSLGMPVTPPSTDHGLGGYLSHMVEKAKARDPETGMSFMDRLGRFGSDIVGDERGVERANQQGAQRVHDAQAVAERAHLQQMADQLGMSPRESLLFQANPEAWAKANADRMGFHAVAGGDTILEGDPSAGGSTGFAPKVGVEGGEGYSATPSGITDTGGLALSPQQKAQDDLKNTIAKATEDYHHALIGLGAQRNNIAQQRVNKPPLGNGGDWRSRVVGHGVVQ